MATDKAAGFPCALTLEIPFPTARLASVAHQALRVDKELSALVQRQLSTAAPTADGEQTVLRVEYKATTNRMLRVAVNSFLDSVALVLEVMGELDEDLVAARYAQQNAG